ncbi:hypothetical protein C1H46_006834 [Malus baccata]|uniref:RNA polymerase II transcription factor B subunit 2 n=1 Tax=Malus baccata TaxID=106549 RepID=A0A540N8Y7_MALBA|nr:hypothetical protein C1H46_006834 [Malus baccata]
MRGKKYDQGSCRFGTDQTSAGKERRFIPTNVATNLLVSLTDSSSRKQGFVVVETNFRLYAYSISKLHCEILCLFLAAFPF